MDMSREDICRLALTAVDPVTLGRKVWLKPGVNKLDGKFLSLSDPALKNVQAWIIHAANKGFFGTTLAVVGNAPSQVLQFDSGKMISVSKGQKIQLKTGDIVYLLEERHPFMVLHVAVNETGTSAAGAQSQSNGISILDDSKVVQTIDNSTHTSVVLSSEQSTSSANANDSTVVEPNMSVSTVLDTSTKLTAPVLPVQEEEPKIVTSTPTAAPQEQAVEKKEEAPASEPKWLHQKTYEERKQEVKQRIIVSPIYKVVCALDVADFVSKYGEPLTSRKYCNLVR